MKKLALITSLVACMLFVGCNAATVSQKAEAAINIAVSVAKAEQPFIPAADQQGYTGFVALLAGLNGQLDTCNANVSGMTGKGAKFLACFNAFAAGLGSPQELAELRLMSPQTQAKVQIYVAAIVAGVNIAVPALGGKQVAAPVVSASAVNIANTSPELTRLEVRMAQAAGL